MRCAYYQAEIKKNDCWFFVAVLRSFEHVAFDRTIDVETSRFEFFVPVDVEQIFLTVLNYFERQGIASGLVKLPNRL